MRGKIILAALTIAFLGGGYMLGNDFSISDVQAWAQQVANPPNNPATSYAGPSTMSGPPKVRGNNDAEISSPKAGDKFCYGQVIPIRWTSPPDLNIATVLLVAPGVDEDPIATVIGIRDISTPVVHYSYDWDGAEGVANTFHAGQFVAEGNAYHMAIALDFKDGSGEKIESKGTFSIADCHIQGITPPRS